jgi:hypothetical protein
MLFMLGAMFATPEFAAQLHQAFLYEAAGKRTS